MKDLKRTAMLLIGLLSCGLALASLAETYSPMDCVEADGKKYFQMPFKSYGQMTTEARVWLPNLTGGNVQFALAGGGDLWTIAFAPGNLAYCHLSEKHGNWGVSDYAVASGAWVDIKTENFSTGYYLYVKDPAEGDYGDPVYTKLYTMSPVQEEDGAPMVVLGLKSGNNVLKIMPTGTKLAWIKFWRKDGADVLQPVADLKPYVDGDGFEYLKDEIAGTYTMASGLARIRYFVNYDSGLDTNSGTAPDQAFKTLEYAVNTMASGSQVPCLIRVGGDRYPVTYPLSASLSISCANLTLKGETGNARDVVLDAGRRDFTPISFANIADSRVESLTISNGYHTGGMGGIQLRGTRPVASNIVVTCCESSTASYHMGVVTLNWGGTLQDSWVVANTNSNNGGVVMLSRGGRVERCVIANNKNASFGGGLSACHLNGTFKDSNGMIVDSCIITNNTAAYGGGVGDVPKVVNCRIENNTATLADAHGNGGGGVFLQTAKIGNDFLDVLVTNCVIASNSTPDGGGGINYFNSSVSNLLIDACVVTNNSVLSGYRNRGGAGIAIWSNPVQAGGVVTIRNSLVADNYFAVSQPNSQGSGILANAGSSGGKIRIENCTVAGNRNNGSYKSAINCIGTVELVNVAAVDNFDTAGNAIHGITSMASGASRTDDGTWAANISHSLLYPAEATWTFGAEQKVENGEAPRFCSGSYIPRATSPLRDAGAALDWHAGASDLQRAEPEPGKAVGVPIRSRVIGAAVDIGCYEYDCTSGLMLLVR